MKPVKVGVLGCSQIARRLVLPAILETSLAKIVAVASQHNGMKLAEETAAPYHSEPLDSYDKLLDRSDIEAVYISLPSALQPQWVEKALLRKKHVLVEKKMAPTLAESERLVSLARQKGVRLLEGYMFRFHPQHHFVRENLRAEVGEVRSLEAHFGFTLDPKNFRWNPALRSDALNDVGGYPLCAVRFYFGDPEEIQSILFSNATGVVSRGSVMMRFSGGRVAHCTFGFDFAYRCEYRIWGTQGVLHVNRAFTTPKDMKPQIRLETDPKRTFDLPPANHFALMWESFLKSVRGAESLDYEAELLSQARLLERVRTEGAQTLLSAA